MTFANESEAIRELADAVVSAGANMFKASKYLYALIADQYYNCSIKDFIRVLLNNMYNSDALKVFRVSIEDEACSALNTREYFNVYRLIAYSFAVRLPALCHVDVDGARMTDRQVDAVYKAVLERGVENYGGAVAEKYADIRGAVKRGRTPIPYNSEWFRVYVFSNVAELAELTNRNLLFLGAMDVILTLYYLCLEEDFKSRIRALCGGKSALSQG